MLIHSADLRHTTDKPQTYRFCEPCQPLTMGADLLMPEDGLNVCLTLTRIGSLFLVTGAIQARVGVACARCLENFIHPVDTTFEDEWILAEDLPEYRRDLPDNSRLDDIFCLEQEETDITERVLEHFIVSLPMRFICSDTCRGLCPQCGSNLNVSPCTCQHQPDPRLTTLARWEPETVE